MIKATYTIPEGKQFLLGCDKCDCGRIFLTSMQDGWKQYPLACTIPELLLLMFRDGKYRHCDCDAGQVAARSLEGSAAALAANEVAMRQAVALSAEHRMQRLFDDAHVPDRFASLSLDGYRAIAHSDSGKTTAMQVVEMYMEQGHIDTPRGPRYGLMLYGKSDMGKTGLLSPLFMHYIHQGKPGLWVQYNDLLAALKDFQGGQVEERIKACKFTENLFIDDFGDPAADRAATDYTRDVVFRIVDYRNNYQLPTFITSNLDPGKLTGQFHERIVKRLAELCVMVEVSGDPMHELMDAMRTESKWDKYPAVAGY
jgi:DNA replication protein DnaC